MLTRRNWFFTSAALSAAAQTSGGKEVVISSANGVRACDRALEMIRNGGDTLDAVVAGVNINEDDPEDNSVGYGGLPNEEGIVELDASLMHGPTRRAGSVASVRNIKNPSKLAKLVMDWYINYLPHVGLPAHRYQGTRIVDVAWLTPLVLGHNYHAIHHLWPKVPWHRYREVFRERQELLRQHGVPIEHRVFERRFPGRELPAHTPVSG